MVLWLSQQHYPTRGRPRMNAEVHCVMLEVQNGSGKGILHHSQDEPVPSLHPADKSQDHSVRHKSDYIFTRWHHSWGTPQKWKDSVWGHGEVTQSNNRYLSSWEGWAKHESPFVMDLNHLLLWGLKRSIGNTNRLWLLQVCHEKVTSPDGPLWTFCSILWTTNNIHPTIRCFYLHWFAESYNWINRSK